MLIDLRCTFLQRQKQTVFDLVSDTIFESNSQKLNNGKEDFVLEEFHLKCVLDWEKFIIYSEMGVFLDIFMMTAIIAKSLK